MITLTTNAASEIRRIIAENSLPEGTALRLGIKGGGCAGFTYVFDFDHKIGEFDRVFETNGMKVVIDRKSLLYIDGTEIDFKTSLMERGFKFRLLMFPACPSCGQPQQQYHRCPDCDILLPFPVAPDLFGILSLPIKYNTDTKTAEEAYENIMLDLHPDFFEQKDSTQKLLSLQWSGLAKQARDMLIHPQKRAKYIFSHAFPGQTETVPDPDFIDNMFALREKLADEPVDALISKTREDLAAFEMQCATVFEAIADGDRTDDIRMQAASLLGQFKFWINVRDVLNGKHFHD
ncbi:hypothetical protein CHS0354_035355 [Potamilus streckersoni]|uniref:Core domain-containing protein n=1 Tax=Potamilus streckersoni TaxID=2493646 RepID=A0AAE0S321_9BIVA|nr:hypothetical protein CHS0354_035355 [Potamilus streckersoni]